jgi:hypothetical protein
MAPQAITHKEVSFHFNESFLLKADSSFLSDFMVIEREREIRRKEVVNGETIGSICCCDSAARFEKPQRRAARPKSSRLASVRTVNIL